MSNATLKPKKGSLTLEPLDKGQEQIASSVVKVLGEGRSALSLGSSYKGYFLALAPQVEL